MANAPSVVNKLFDRGPGGPHSLPRNMSINTLPKDRRGEPYTEERVRSHARAHVAYGWGPNPGSCTGGDQWTPELDAAYADEYRKARATRFI